MKRREGTGTPALLRQGGSALALPDVRERQPKRCCRRLALQSGCRLRCQGCERGWFGGRRSPGTAWFLCRRYKAIVKYKTAFYSFYLPVAAAMYMVSVVDAVWGGQ